jgi:signal transduction histidine kinase
MRASATIFVFLLATASISAQDAPDYSKDQLLRLFAAAAEHETENPIRYRRGAIEFRALGTSWRFNYLPMMAMHGTLTGVSMEWPDPFALTNTPLATSPRSWRTRREVSSELRRIEKTERAKIKVTVGSQ